MLNEVVSEFDELAERHRVEKIKTIGDAYMVVGGLPIPRPDHAELVAEMGLDMLTALADLNKRRGSQLRVRIGIQTGPAVAGVIGKRKFIYDLWGDTVNMASRMEANGLPGRIQVGETTYRVLHGKYEFSERGLIELKGKGPTPTYLLERRRAGVSRKADAAN